MILALGACAFGVGALASDPSLPRGSGWVVFLVTLAELAWLPRILEALSAAPLASSAALLGLGFAGIELFLRPGALRRRPLLSVADLGLAYRSDAASVDPTMNGARGQRLRVRLPEGRIEGDDGWMRASFLENFGWMRGGVAGAFFGHALFWMVFRLAQTALFSPNREALSAAAQGLVQAPQASSGVASLVATTTGIFWITNSLALRTSAGYPVSRAERARVLWRAALVTNVGLHLVLALVLLAVSLLVARFAGEGWRPPSPDFARVLALSLLAAPLVQGARLRFIDGKARALTSLELGLLAGIAIIVLVVTLRAGCRTFARAARGRPAGLAGADRPGPLRGRPVRLARVPRAALQHLRARGVGAAPGRASLNDLGRGRLGSLQRPRKIRRPTGSRSSRFSPGLWRWSR